MWRNPLVRFLACFVLIYGLLILPWPGWNDLYGQYFRGISSAVFSPGRGDWVVIFQPHERRHDFSELTSQMTIGNRQLTDSAGHEKAQKIDLDTRSIGWIPTALTMALILATPIPWKRRLGALVLGLGLVQIYVLFSLQTCIWDQYSTLVPTTFSSFWQQVVADLDYTLIDQLGASFTIPLFIWLLVTFRRTDGGLFWFQPGLKPELGRSQGSRKRGASKPGRER